MRRATKIGGPDASKVSIENEKFRRNPAGNSHGIFNSTKKNRNDAKEKDKKRQTKYSLARAAVRGVAAFVPLGHSSAQVLGGTMTTGDELRAYAEAYSHTGDTRVSEFLDKRDADEFVKKVNYDHGARDRVKRAKKTLVQLLEAAAEKTCVRRPTAREPPKQCPAPSSIPTSSSPKRRV